MDGTAKEVRTRGPIGLDQQDFRKLSAEHVEPKLAVAL